MTDTEQLEAKCQVGDVSARLATHVNGWAITIKRPDGPGCRISFGLQARLLRARTTGSGMRVEYQPHPAAAPDSHGVLAVVAELELDESGRLTLTLDAPAEFPCSELRGPVLEPLDDRPASADWRFLVPDGEGLLLRGDGAGPGQRPRVSFNAMRITLPMTALVDGRGRSVVVSATQGHDQAVDLHPAGDERELPGLGLACLATLGRWGYRREWRIAPLASGGVAAIAAEVSHELTRAGITLRTQSEKLADLGIPTPIGDSVRGTALWCHFDTLTDTIVSDLDAAGLRAVRVMGRPSSDTARAALARSGYASGPYFQTYDVFPPGSLQELGWRGTYPPEGATDGWPDDLIRDMAGWLDPAWTYLPFPAGTKFWDHEDYLKPDGTIGLRRRHRHDQTPVRSYRRCPAAHRRVVEQRGLPMLDSIGATAVFYDIATAMWGLECYAPDHPVDRRQDVGYRREALDTLAASNRPVFSEAGKWWAIDHLNGFEGLFSYDQEMHEDCIQLTDYPEDPRRRGYEFDLEHRVPLFGMVARHAVTRTMWWGTGQDRHPATQPSKDAITALFGANPIFVVDPDHPLVPGTPRWSRFARTGRAFDLLAEVARDARVSSYQTSGPNLGRTEFDGGASVEANVGFAAEGGLAPGEFLIKDPAGRTVAAIDPQSDE